VGGVLNQLLFNFFNLFRNYSEEDRRLASAILRLVGKPPKNLSVYKLAFSHPSASKLNHIGFKESNERLEYLGDAVLGAIVADYLFRKYPYEDEGFLTEIRSRMVNRESLNELAHKMGLDSLIIYEGNRYFKGAYKSMSGDALEAFVGAVYLDRGFASCYQFVLKKLIRKHFDLESIISNNKNYKSIIIEWAQREAKELRFEIIKESGTKHQKEFVAQLFINDEPFATGIGFSKKKAEQASAQKACEFLKLNVV
jgi:ribonuclease III